VAEKRFKPARENSFRGRSFLKNRIGKIAPFLLAFLMVSGVSAIDVNSSTDLRYYNDGGLEFEIGTNGDTRIPNGYLDLEGEKIVGLADPTDPQDAVTKSYIDSKDDGPENLSETLAAGNIANQTIRFQNGVRIGDSSTSVSSQDSVVVGARASEDSGGEFNTVLGYNSGASGGQSLAVGQGSQTTNYYSTAVGTDSEASASAATALGRLAAAQNEDALAIGRSSWAQSNGAVAIGAYANAPNSYEATFGNFNGNNLDVNITGNLTVHGANGINMESNPIRNLENPSNPQDATTKSYVDSSDDTIADDQNLQDVLVRGDSAGGNQIRDLGGLNITNSSSGTQIATFEETGISLKQPLSVESSGPLSVSNGMELTGTSSNSIESYSTFYLSTSSGSPSDIVLDPTGEVGISSDLNIGGNNITSTAGNVSVGQDLKVHGDVWSAGADLAEVYSSPQELEKGEVVAIDTQRDDSVVRTAKTFQKTVTGVVSTDPGNTLNWNEEGYPIALTGKVPVKVSEENGEIKRGDRLVPSSKQGIAMRCSIWDPTERKDESVRGIIAHNEDCRSSNIGRALENSKGKDKVLVKIK